MVHKDATHHEFDLFLNLEDVADLLRCAPLILVREKYKISCKFTIFSKFYIFVITQMTFL